MSKEKEGPTKIQIRQAKQLADIFKNLPQAKLGGPEHKLAKDRMLYLLIQEQEKIVHALIRKAKTGDVRAIVEFFDRLYGKAKETIDFNSNVQFSLKDLAKRREELKVTTIRTIDAELLSEPKEESEREEEDVEDYKDNSLSAL